MQSNVSKIKKAFTHGGIFHADDVFATALLKILNPNIEVCRGNTVPENFEGIVYDIGGGEFDHHQSNKRIRSNGVPYAAFGLLWERYGEEIIGREAAEKFDEDFIQPLDLSDNTGEKNTLCQLISDRNTTWKETEKDIMQEFEEAVKFAQEILKNRFRQISAKQEAYHIVREKAIVCKNQILYLEQAMPWKEAVKDLDILYVIFPSLRGGYCIQAVPQEEQILKKPFPFEWCGASKEELKEITGITTFRFCHPSGFLSTADQLEDAKKIAELAIKWN